MREHLSTEESCRDCKTRWWREWMTMPSILQWSRDTGSDGSFLRRTGEFDVLKQEVINLSPTPKKVSCDETLLINVEMLSLSEAKSLCHKKHTSSILWTHNEDDTFSLVNITLFICLCAFWVFISLLSSPGSTCYFWYLCLSIRRWISQLSSCRTCKALTDHDCKYSKNLQRNLRLLCQWLNPLQSTV